jgi:hypothetical protein
MSPSKKSEPKPKPASKSAANAKTMKLSPEIAKVASQLRLVDDELQLSVKDYQYWSRELPALPQSRRRQCAAELLALAIRVTVKAPMAGLPAIAQLQLLANKVRFKQTAGAGWAQSKR